MDRLRQLLEAFGLDPDQPDYATLTDEQLADLHSQALDLFDSIRDGEDAIDLEALTAIADVADALRGEDNARQEQAAADAARIAELEARIRPAGEDSQADADEPIVDETETEPVTADTDVEPDAETVEPEPQAVAAAAAPRISATPRRVPITQLAARRRPANDPVPAGGDTPAVTILAAGDIPGISAGTRLDSVDAVAEALHAKASAVDGVRLTPGQRFHVAKFRTEYPDERKLSSSDAATNAKRVEAVVASARQAFLDGASGGFESLVAAGGLCAPLTVRYDQEVVGEDSRPVRDSLAGFEGRGGVRFIPPPVLSDIDTTGSDAAVAQWTMDQDVAAINDSGTRKPIQRIACGEETTVEIYAVTKRLKVGNVLSRTFPERQRAFIDLTGVAHARLAEGLLLQRIKALSVKTQEDLQLLGSRRDLLAVWIKAIWGMRNRHRAAATPMTLIVPDSVISHAQIDGVRQVPGDQRDRITRDEIIGEMRALGVDVVITPDMPAAMAPPQAEGAQVVDLPSPIEWSLSFMGTFAFLDGGELDFGFQSGAPIRDSGLNAANDFELFGETFENVAKFGGPEAIWGRTLVCPTGTTSGTDEVACGDAS